MCVVWSGHIERTRIIKISSNLILYPLIVWIIFLPTDVNFFHDADDNNAISFWGAEEENHLSKYTLQIYQN